MPDDEVVELFRFIPLGCKSASTGLSHTSFKVTRICSLLVQIEPVVRTVTTTKSKTVLTCSSSTSLQLENNYNRSQMTSNCGESKKMAHAALGGECH